MNPDGKKLGGGVRVKQLTINDGWNGMSNGSAGSFSYGQTYEYTQTAASGEDGIPKGMKISSGVASYEPAIGGEENALHRPHHYTEKYSLSPNNRFYIEKPYGESFMPSPTVGYSRVVVKNIEHGTGYTEHEFYTAKDFPVLIREPYLVKKKRTPSFAKRLFKVGVEDYLTASQSYAIELNDMHGKPKATRIYGDEAIKNENGEVVAISKVEYYYKTDANNASHLSNFITVIGKDGMVKKDKLAGINIDMTIDERESKSITGEFAVKGNVDISWVTPIPAIIPLPSGWPTCAKEVTCFRSITNTKVITRYGILDRVVAEDLGARTETRNMAWDEETGEVLLTRTENDFKDPVYSFTYPAHWGYDGMAGAYKNIGAEATAGGGKIKDAINCFTPGDEVIAEVSPSSYKKGWVTQVTGNSITVLDENGKELKVLSAKVIRSGRRNQPATPIGTVVSLYNPIQGEGLVFKEVLNSSAVEFGSEWAGFCQECGAAVTNGNKYVTGEKGTFRPKKSYAYLTGRTQSDYNRNTNTRKDGVFTSYVPFWNPYGDGKSKHDWKIIRDNWTAASEVTLFSPYGFELENRDALGRYTSASYGYNNTLPTAVSANSRLKQMGFTGFEDALMNENCKIDRLGFDYNSGKYEENISEAQSHTGRYSIRVGAGETVELENVLKECQKEVSK
jgi:hypothetical protein